MRIKKKSDTQICISLFALKVGVTGLEPATSRPPDAYSNQLSYTPVRLSFTPPLTGFCLTLFSVCHRVCFQKRCKVRKFLFSMQIFGVLFLKVFLKMCECVAQLIVT